MKKINLPHHTYLEPQNGAIAKLSLLKRKKVGPTAPSKCSLFTLILFDLVDQVSQFLLLLQESCFPRIFGSCRFWNVSIFEKKMSFTKECLFNNKNNESKHLKNSDKENKTMNFWTDTLFLITGHQEEKIKMILCR